jgi:hypothetical protein
MAAERWKPFFEFTLLDKNRINGLCKLCGKNYKDQNGIFSNFSKHFKRAHVSEYEKIFGREADRLVDDGDVKNGGQTADLTNAKQKKNS